MNRSQSTQTTLKGSPTGEGVTIITMKKPKLLDLYCGQGGCSKGYQLAGFHVTGVDTEPQPLYCGDAFIQANAIDYLLKYGHLYDAISSSPPCQVWTQLAYVAKDKKAYHRKHVDLIPQTREALKSIGRPYVIENVMNAPLEYPIMLCGAMFGLKVYRHRLFETSFFMLAPPHVAHHDKTPGAGRGMSPRGFISVTGNGGSVNLGMPYLKYARMAMGIDWMNRAGLSQAIPPAYTEFIGRHLIEIL